MRHDCSLAHRFPRLLSISIAWLILAWCAPPLLAQPATANSASKPSAMQKLSGDYFREQALQFAQELLLKEEYLTVLYACTAEELKARRKEGLDIGDLWTSLKRQESNPPNRSDSALQAAAIPERYQVWRDFEEQEFLRRNETIMQIRSQLLAQGTPPQKERLFQSELMAAMRCYGRTDYELAKLLFDRLIADYGYSSIDDILYYQGQTCVQLQQYETALQHFQRLLATCPDSPLRTPSYDLASAILHVFRRGREVRSLYADFMKEGAPGSGEMTGGIHVRAAHAEVALGHYEIAAEILPRVQERSEYYLASRYLLADCWSALKDWSKAADVLAGMTQAKRRGQPYERWRMLIDEARVKLAYIHYQQGDFDTAAQVFAAIKSGSSFYDRALMGQAWIAFQLDRYPEAITRSEGLARSYPQSTEIYEAGSLAGYCYEQMGDKDAATSDFLRVLDAGAGRANLQTFLEERRRLSEAMAGMKALEEPIFKSGDEQVFAAYQQTRDQLWICQQRIDLAELLQVNSHMRVLVEERIILDSLLHVRGELQDQVTQSGQGRLVADFLKVEDRILSAMGRLNNVGLEQLKETPLYYKEAQFAYLNARADSLSRQLTKETERLAAALGETQNLRESALKNGDVETAVELGLSLDRLRQAADQTDLNLTKAEISPRLVLATRVDRWSDFSFSRYAMGGMDLEELERKLERLKQVEECLAVLDELIEQRNITQPSSETPEQP